MYSGKKIIAMVLFLLFTCISIIGCTGEDILLFGDLPKSPYLSTFTKGAK